MAGNRAEGRMEDAESILPGEAEGFKDCQYAGRHERGMQDPEFTVKTRGARGGL